MKRGCINLVGGLVGCALAAQFPIMAAAQTERVVYSFVGGTDGAIPEASLTLVKGTLYGTTQQGGGSTYYGGSGTVFAFDRKTRTEKVIYAFCSQQNCADGAGPVAGLINLRGKLFGTTPGGGANCTGAGGCGTLFAIEPDTGAETVVYSFCTQPNCLDGAYPDAALINVNGTLYGTTYFGGSGTDCGSTGCGTVFALNPRTGAENVVWSFAGGADGAYPSAALINVNGTLYGTTMDGGPYRQGTVFSLVPQTGTETVLHAFGNGTDGRYPVASLIAMNGRLYGTTDGGGVNYAGTVFSVDLASNVENVLYSFCSQENCADGANPDGALIEWNGALYGTAASGGRFRHRVSGGTVFSLDLATGAENTLYAFCSRKACSDGEAPLAGLTNVNGIFYGTTALGGASAVGGGCFGNGCGTIFVLKNP